MRKFLLIIMTTLCITAISAQSLYGKRLENKADNSLVSQNVEETNISFPREYQFVEVYTKPNRQEVIVHPIHSTTITSSSQLSPGKCYLLFEVIHAEDPSLIGCHVSCRILERRKSNISGSEGRLAILPLYIKTPSGNKNVRPVPIMRRGKNISNVKFWTFPLIVPIFIPGTGAKILPHEIFTLILE